MVSWIRYAIIAVLVGACASPRVAEDMVVIPEGVYWHGARDPHYVAPYAIDRDEVSEAEYDRCVSDGPCTAPRRLLQLRTPMTVTWVEARTYCAWRSARLPTEIEWEVAARGRSERRYPWGDEMIHDCELVRGVRCVSSVDLDKFTLDVSEFGARHMFGNEAEWVADFAVERGRATSEHEHKGQRAVRGRGDEKGFATFRTVAWATIQNWDRHAAFPNVVHGFRCVRSIL